MGFVSAVKTDLRISLTRSRKRLFIERRKTYAKEQRNYVCFADTLRYKAN